MKLTITTFQGIEEILAEEVRKLGGERSYYFKQGSPV